MSKKQIETKVKSAFTRDVPDVLQSVIADCENRERKGIIMTMENRKRKNFKGILAAAAAFALVIASVAVMFVYSNYFAAATLVSLDVNPAIDIKVNKNDRVLDVVAGNDDAVKVIGNMDFKGSQLEVTFNALVGSMLSHGYLSDSANSILISVDNKDEVKSKTLSDKLTALANELFKNDSFEGAVIGQSIDGNADALAKTYDITEGKAQLINEIIANNPNYTFEELAKLTINELNLICHRADTSPASVTTVGTASEKQYIGHEKAKTIAFKDAGVSNTDIYDYEWEMDYDGGVMLYEIEFEVGGREYDYDIHATTGEILRPSANVKNEPQTQTTVDPNAKIKTEAEAKAIALSDAGVKAADIFGYEIELDRDDGVTKYEIEFKSGKFEYNYDIDAVSGKILKSEKDIDD